ncbi:uncharacterized protein BXZ73DRAFT_105312 [Epithele typhae]|uniref:uncharacterized protein n=1 Tax=Epithele typhae TaxID=378194 RepID=UPI0020082A59|nr:uncharacterized protein BXZ73DRAFT_105312 [Epithele typhae]KAH9918187.1 hypothetical protein BXZ73DRAFT_105312 [Epithele typhae]
MKVNVTEEELAAHEAATMRGAIEGIVAGLAISVPASIYAHRRWAAYRALPLHLKALGIIMVVGPCYAIQAEQRGVQYDKSLWTGAANAVMHREEMLSENRWEQMTVAQKVKDWASRNQYKVIVGSWAASMAIAGTIVMRNRYQSTPQKIVQARMWAQGLTIGVIIAAGIMTQSQRAEHAQHRQVDHSWANILAEQERERHEMESRIASVKSHVQPAPSV